MVKFWSNQVMHNETNEQGFMQNVMKKMVSIGFVCWLGTGNALYF